MKNKKCAKKKINIFGCIIKESARNTFEELAKIFRKKRGCFEIFDFNLSNSNNIKDTPFFSSIKINNEESKKKEKNSKENPSEPEKISDDPQNTINRNFNNNSLMAIGGVVSAIKSKKDKNYKCS